jgi:hypothetical protein
MEVVVCGVEFEYGLDQGSQLQDCYSGVLEGTVRRQ